MKVTIKRWDNNEVIICGEYESLRDCLEKNKEKSFYYANLRYADLRYADLRYADLRYANLRYANLRYANLRYADLRYANLRYANLRYTDLRYADLSNANLRYANLRYTDLSNADLSKIPQINIPTINEFIKIFNLEKKGISVFLFKGVTKNLESPLSAKKIKYEIGKMIKVDFADCDVWNSCSFGISVSPTIEAAKTFGEKVLKVKVNIGDIICIPIYGFKTKIRVKKCKVMEEV